MAGDEQNAPFRLGRYELIGKIASGGMATVYRGRKSAHGGFEREFAIKVVHPHLSAVDGFTERFLDEARVASRVHHPNVCAVIDIEADRGYQYLVLELIDGVTIRQSQVWGDGAPLEPEEAARIVADTAHGLEALHAVTDEHGEPLEVVHRDLSPHNLMIDTTGRTVLIDLGLAAARDKLGHTQTGVLCGKLPYMSPEQSLLEDLDHRSDLFSLGTVLFELVTGELPFGEDHTPDTLDRLRKCDTDALLKRAEASGVPSWLRDIIAKCLRVDPDARFARADDLAQALEAEMHMRGFEQADIRNRIAVRVRQTQDAIGAEEPMAPLPVPIHVPLDRSGALDGAAGSLRAPIPEFGAPPARRGMSPALLGALAFVVVVAAGLALLPGRIGDGWSGESRRGVRGDDATLGNLERADANRSGAASAHIETKQDGQKGAGGRNGAARGHAVPEVESGLESPADTEGVVDTDGDELDGLLPDELEPETPRTSRRTDRRRRSSKPKLMGNPYTD